MQTDTVYRMRDDQVEQVLELLASTGSTRRTAETWAADHMTALLLGDAQSPVAAMPMAIRNIRVAGNRTMNVGWLSSNQFASRMSWRGQSRNSEPTWAGQLPDLDALLVVQRDEFSLAARWYDRVGFNPVLAIRCLYLEMEESPVAPSGRYHTQVAGVAEIAAWESQMREVYHDAFAHFGGPMRRDTDGFWQKSLTHHYYRDHYQFQVLGLWNGATLMGYAVIGWSGWHSRRPRMDILELATRQWDTQIAQELLQTTSQLAWSKDVHQVRAVVSVHDPYRAYLARSGFVDRWGYVMGMKWLTPQRWLDERAKEWPTDTVVQLNVPGKVSLTLQRPAGNTAAAAPAQRVVKFSGDQGTITRLLTQRLELAAAVREGQLVALDARDEDINSLSVLFPWSPWVFHMADFI